MAERIQILLQSIELRMKESRRAYSAVMEKEKKQRITLESIGEGVIVTDWDGDVVRMNKVATELTGYTLVEGIGMSLSGVLHVEVDENVNEADNLFKEIVSKQIRISLPHYSKLTAKTGKRYYVSVSGSPILMSRQ